ncbi:MAG: hypothetical protein WA709_25850 [Stellaceae bacterium]
MPISDPELYPCRSAGQSRVSNDVLCQLAALRCGFYSEVIFIGVGPAVFLFRYYTAVCCTACASGYVSSVIGNPRVSRFLESHHPEILTEFRAIVAATSLEESGSGVSEEPAFSG